MNTHLPAKCKYRIWLIFMTARSGQGPARCPAGSGQWRERPGRRLGVPGQQGAAKVQPAPKQRRLFPWSRSRELLSLTVLGPVGKSSAAERCLGGLTPTEAALCTFPAQGHGASSSKDLPCSASGVQWGKQLTAGRWAARLDRTCSHSPTAPGRLRAGAPRGRGWGWASELPNCACTSCDSASWLFGIGPRSTPCRDGPGPSGRGLQARSQGSSSVLPSQAVPGSRLVRATWEAWLRLCVPSQRRALSLAARKFLASLLECSRGNRWP